MLPPKTYLFVISDLVHIYTYPLFITNIAVESFSVFKLMDHKIRKPAIPAIFKTCLRLSYISYIHDIYMFNIHEIGKPRQPWRHESCTCTGGFTDLAFIGISYGDFIWGSGRGWNKLGGDEKLVMLMCF